MFKTDMFTEMDLIEVNAGWGKLKPIDEFEALIEAKVIQKQLIESKTKKLDNK